VSVALSALRNIRKFLSGVQWFHCLAVSPVGLDQAKNARVDALAVPCWSAGAEKDLGNGCWGEEELLGF